MFPEMRSMNLKTFSKLFLIPGFLILINGLASKLPHCKQLINGYTVYSNNTLRLTEATVVLKKKTFVSVKFEN